MLALSVDPSFVAAAATMLAAVIAGLAAVSLHLLGQRQAARERRRQTCASALSDALLWLELPYRVRRRQDDSAGTLAALVDRMHDLQQNLLFHESWLRIEVPEAHEAYQDLVNAVKESAVDPLREAWAEEPVGDPKDESIGSLNLDPVEDQVKAFAEVVKKVLSAGLGY